MQGVDKGVGGMSGERKLYAVIMAGGKGTRFWPYSREKRPKQFLNIVGKGSMLQQTIERIRPLIEPEKILIVTAQEQVEETRRQLPDLPGQNILIEPQGKNTAPCLGLAAVYLHRYDPHGVMCALPADHYIEKEEEFREVISRAHEFLQGEDYLITLGIQPSRPETGYGYIEVGRELKVLGDKKIHQANRFLEKPDAELARRLVDSGGYLWNSGMFIWRISSLLREIETHLPAMYEGLQRISSALATPQEKETIREVYEGLTAISIDKGVMEKASGIAVIPCQLGWNDVGSWTSLYDLLSVDESGNIVRGDHIGIDSRGCLIMGGERLIATVGLQDVMIIETEDVLLICPRGEGQRIRELVDQLRDRGLVRYL